MGIKKSKSAKTVVQPSLADALFPKVRQRVLGVLMGEPGRSFYTTEVIALADSGSGAVQRELTTLADAGLLTVTRQGHQKHYQANENSPVFMELYWLVIKTMSSGKQPT
jgi:predicted transcriptional regulator